MNLDGFINSRLSKRPEPAAGAFNVIHIRRRTVLHDQISAEAPKWALPRLEPVREAIGTPKDQIDQVVQRWTSPYRRPLGGL